MDKTTPSEQDVEIDRRYLITRKGATPDYLLPVKFMDDSYDAFAPRESVRIKKKGGGLNFVHGGISLQEMVVPVIEYHYLRNDSKAYQRNKAKYDTKPVEVGLLSASRKISNMIFSLNFYQKDAVGDNRSAANYLLYGDAIDHYFRLGKNLNQRDTIAVRRMADGYLKLLYPDGSFTKEEVEEVLQISLEMRRRVKEQLKKLGGMEFYDVNFSYIDNETFEEHYVSVPEQGGGKLIPEGMCNPGQIYTVSQGKSGMLGVFRLESQMLPGNGKFERTGIGSDRDAKESTNTAFNFLKANGNRISGSISTTTKDYIINYQDLQGIGMTGKLALPTLIAMCSIALGKPTLSSLAVLGEISISGTMMKVDELANSLQVCLDSGAKRVLLPITSAAELGTVPADLIGSFNLIFYSSAEDAVFKALGVE